MSEKLKNFAWKSWRHCGTHFAWIKRLWIDLTEFFTKMFERMLTFLQGFYLKKLKRFLLLLQALRQPSEWNKQIAFLKQITLPSNKLSFLQIYYIFFNFLRLKVDNSTHQLDNCYIIWLCQSQTIVAKSCSHILTQSKDHDETR